MKIARWIAVIPAAIIFSILVTFPLHWIIIIAFASTDNFILGMFSIETIERLAMAFTTPYFFIYSGTWIAPAHRIVTSTALAIIIALCLGCVYTLSFLGFYQISGWSSLFYGATPILNLVGIASALLYVQKKWKTEKQT